MQRGRSVSTRIKASVKRGKVNRQKVGAGTGKGAGY